MTSSGSFSLAAIRPSRVEVRVALTLRFVAGLTTRQIAAAFVLPEATLAQRLVRAKRKISESGIRFEVPRPDALAGRLDGVHAVVYLVFNEGYAASGGDADRRGPVRGGDLAGPAAAPAAAGGHRDRRPGRADAAAPLPGGGAAGS